MRKVFVKNVQARVAFFNKYGNPFQEDSAGMLVVDTKEIVDPIVAQSVYNTQNLGQQQFDEFVSKRVVGRTVPLDETIVRRQLTLFGNHTKIVCKTKCNQKSMKSDL